MAQPAYAVIDIECNPAQLAQLAAIPNLVIDVQPIRTSDPTVVRVSARADAAAEADARALGVKVTLAKSAEEYREEIEDAFRGFARKDADPEPR